MLKVRILDTRATLPTVSNPGEDLGYDLYAIQNEFLVPGVPTKIRTGVSALYSLPESSSEYNVPFGLLIRDRSSMAAKGIVVTGGVVDAGYRGEIIVVLTLSQRFDDRYPHESQLFDPEGAVFVGQGYKINKGDKIAQAIPIPVLTSKGVSEVAELPSSARGQAGFGSSGV